MNIKTKKLITKIKENYDINNLDDISILPFGGEDVLYIQDTMYDIPEDLDDAELDELASNIVDDIIDKDKEEKKDIEKSTALLAALNSEKEAVELYQKLLEVVEEKDEIELLTKILDDEKEHISLLSGLQSSKTANSVANDNKKQLNDYAKDIIRASLE